MALKTNYAVLGSALILCLMVFTVYAAVIPSTTGEFSADPDTVYITWEDIGYGCYANDTTLTAASGSIDLTIENVTNDIPSSFYVYNGAEYDKEVTVTTTPKDVTLIFDPASLVPGVHGGNVDIFKTSNASEMLALTVYVVIPEDLSELVNSGPIPKINIGRTDETLYAKFFINNTEDYLIEVLQVDNTTTLRSGTHYMTYTHDLSDSSSVNGGDDAVYTATIHVDTSETGNVPGIYRDQIKITADNGCPNQTYNLTISANLTTELNVAVTANSSLSTDRSRNISVGVAPTYLDGLFVDSLTKTNFTANLIHRNLSKTYTDVTILDAVDKGTYYNVTLAVPSTALGGDYKVQIDVEDGLGTTTHNSGTGYFGYFTVHRPALFLESDCDGRSVDVDDTFDCDQTVTNYGDVTAYDVNLTYSGYTDCLTLVDSDDDEEDIAVDEDVIFTATFKAKTESDDCEIRIVGDSDGSSYDWFDKTIFAAITVDGDVVTTTTSSTTESLGSGSSHKLTVTPPATFEIVQGEEVSKNVVVKNSGAYTEKNVVLTLSGADASWYDVTTGAQSIVPTLDKTYAVDFTIPENAEPIEYTITYKAKSDATEGSATGKMKVMPSEETIEMIESNLTDYQEWYYDMLNLFNDTKMAGGNTTDLDDIDEMLSSINGLLISADSHIKLEEYFEAYQSLKEARILLEDVETKLRGERSEFEQMIFENFILVAGGIIIAVALVGYYFYMHSPRRGYSPYKPRGVDMRLKIRPKVSGMKLKYEHFRKEFKAKKDKLLKKV